MSEETEQNKENGEGGKPSHSTTVAHKVAEQIKNSGQRVADIVIEKLVEIEVVKRTDIVIKGLAALKKAKGELNKVNRADVKQFSLPGVEAPSVYSEARNKEIIAAKSKVKQLTDLIDNALEKNDDESYTKLENGCKGDSGKGTAGAGSEA